MAHRKSAIKRIRTSTEARLRNRAWRSRLRTHIKAVRTAETQEQAQAALDQAIPVIDRTANRGMIHTNAAARYKSGLVRFVKRMTEEA